MKGKLGIIILSACLLTACNKNTTVDTALSYMGEDETIIIVSDSKV